MAYLVSCTPLEIIFHNDMQSASLVLYTITTVNVAQLGQGLWIRTSFNTKSKYNYEENKWIFNFLKMFEGSHLATIVFVKLVPMRQPHPNGGIWL